MIYAVIFLLGLIVGLLGMLCLNRRKAKQIRASINYLNERYEILSRWFYRNDSNLKISDELIKKGIHRVAVYGLGELGHHLIGELEHSEIEIAYVVDRRKDIANCGYPLYQPTDNLKPVDAMIITTMKSFDAVCNDLKGKIDTQFINLVEIL